MPCRQAEAPPLSSTSRQRKNTWRQCSVGFGVLRSLTAVDYQHYLDAREQMNDGLLLPTWMDLMMWAVLIGEQELAHHLWPRVLRLVGRLGLPWCTAPPHLPAWWLPGLRPRPRPAERRLSSLEARRAPSSPPSSRPQMLRSLDLPVSSGAAAAARRAHREPREPPDQGASERLVAQLDRRREEARGERDRLRGVGRRPARLRRQPRGRQGELLTPRTHRHHPPLQPRSPSPAPPPTPEPSVRHLPPLHPLRRRRRC